MMSKYKLTVDEDMANRQVVDYSVFSRWEEVQDIPGLKHFKIFGNEWKYCAEGNSNIVIALQEEPRVIRLPKHNIGDNCEDLSYVKRKIIREVIFANNIFGPLLGFDVIGAVDIVQISRDQILKLNNSMKNIRPRNRLHKELGIPFATSRTDFTRIHPHSSKNTDYCIEIKPKQGWWNKTILGESSNLCTFCLNQFLKLKEKKISERSYYCPLDLFSGEPSRMIGALKFLISSPQNNLRVFKNGELIYNENEPPKSLIKVLDDWFSGSNSAIGNSPLHNFLYLICTALLKPQKIIDKSDDSTKSEGRYEILKSQLMKILTSNEEIIQDTASNQSRNHGCNETFDALPERSLLSRVLSAQKLGQCGTESIYSLYRKICPIHSFSPSECACPSPECIEEDKWLDEISDLPLTEIETLCIENYLLAATVKDCSVMITFSPIIPNWNKLSKIDAVLHDLRGGKHEVKIGVADLDPKPVTSIAKHYVRDFDMFQAYKKATL